jgi:hypothetical protein
MAYSQDWLESPAARCILAVVTVFDLVANADISVYLSNAGYNTQDGQVVFNPIINASPQLDESISLDGSLSLRFGDIELNNSNHEYDSWLDPSKYIWNNRPIKIYYGDPSWVSDILEDIDANFSLILNGMVSGIDSSNSSVINIKIADKAAKLNTPVSEVIIGTYGTWAGGQTNKASLKPLVFGEAHNITPILIDPATLEYLYSYDGNEQITEIRDNGVPIHRYDGTINGATINLTTGTFRLYRPLVGTCTVSVQGTKKSIDLTTGFSATSYINNIANIITVIATQYGKVDSLLNSFELDLVNLRAFEVANSQPIGIYITSKINKLELIQSICASVGAQVYFTRAGKLQILRIGDALASDTTISDADILNNTLNIVRRTEVKASTKLGYSKNWTVQEGLVTDIPEAHKELFGLEWLTTDVATDSTVQSQYLLNIEPTEKNTYLIQKSSAQAEALRLNNFSKVPRNVYGMTCTTKMMSLQLGQYVYLESLSNKFGLANGKDTQVVSLSPNWSQGTVYVELIEV